MKNTDEIIDAAVRLAKNRAQRMKLPLPERQRIKSIIQDAYIAGYSEALRDARNHMMVG